MYLSILLTTLVGLCMLSTAVSAEVTPQIIVKITGCAYDDLNCNGRLDQGEPTLEGGTLKLYRYIFLLDRWIYECSQTSSCYEFIVLAGVHKVVYVPPTDYEPGNALVGDCGCKLDESTLKVSSLFGRCANNNFLACKSKVTRQCFVPVTFTPGGWHQFCDPDNGIIPGGMVFSRFLLAFKCFEFFGKEKPNELRVGNERIFLRYIGKTACLDRLCLLLGGECTGCGKLNIPLDCPWRLTSSDGGGCLAVETITLLLNVAYNDMRLMPRTNGVDLECYTIAEGPFKGKTVAEVFNIANGMLGGKPPCVFGLASCEQLVFILRQINANYEFIDFETFIDNGFLIPNEPSDPFDEAHCPKVPMCCKEEEL